MARYNPIKNSMAAGEVSPRVEGRDDKEWYFQSLRSSMNGLIVPHGGHMRRSGTRFAAEAQFVGSSQVQLVPFVVAVDQAYMLELGESYVRFYTGQARLESGGSPVEISSPYGEDEVHDLQWTQEADVMYLVHDNHPPYKLQRTAATTFTLTKVAFSQGRAPLLPQNLDATLTVTITGSGPYTLTWSSDIGLASADDVGRAVRISDGTNNAWYLITAVSSGAVATATKQNSVGPVTSAYDDWALGTFSDTHGCRAVNLYEGRLGYGGFLDAVDREILSVSDDFDNFEVVDPAAEDAENADKAISKRMVSHQVNTIQWFVGVHESLVTGTFGGEFRVHGANEDILTPLGAHVTPAGYRGSAAAAPVLVDNQIYYIQRNNRKLQRLTFDGLSSVFTSEDVTILSEHILEAGATELAYQQDPDSTIWARLEDGRLVGFTAEREQEIVGAHPHRIAGGAADDWGAVDSIGVIPTPDNKADQLWLAVRRTIDGSDVMYIEYMDIPFRPGLTPRSTEAERRAAAETAYFVDGGLSLDVPVGGGISAITNASPAVVTTASAHGLSDGDRVRIRGATGMTEINNRSFLVANKTSTTIELTELEGVDVDSTGYGAYVKNGVLRQEVNALSGLDHLEGEEIQILLDGATHPNRTVASGAVSLERYGSIAHAGLGYPSYAETQRFTGGGRLGTDQGQQARVQRVVLRVQDSRGGFAGAGANPAADDLEEILYEDAGETLMDVPDPLYTGDVEFPVDDTWNSTPTVYWEQRVPLPFTVLAVMPRMKSGER